MSSFHRILVGWDGSKDSRQAFRTATRLAVELHAEVVVLAVLKRPSRAEAADEAAEDSAHRRSEVVDEMRTEARHEGAATTVRLRHEVIEADQTAPAFDAYARARVRSRRRRQTRPRPGGAPAHRRRERASGPPRRLPGDGGGLRLKSPTSLSRRPEAQRVGQHQPRTAIAWRAVLRPLVPLHGLAGRTRDRGGAVMKFRSHRALEAKPCRSLPTATPPRRPARRAERRACRRYRRRGARTVGVWRDERTGARAPEPGGRGRPRRARRRS